MTEQLAFYEALGEGTAINRHKGFVFPLALFVEFACNQFFPGPRFSKNQYG